MTALRFRIALLLLMAALCVPLAQADPITGNDPRIIINDPPSCITITSITSTTFTFSADSTGQGFLCFLNESGVGWFNISIDVPLPPSTTFPDDFHCESDTFATCMFTLNGGILNIFFTDGLLPDDGRFFTIDLTSPDSVSGWGPNASFTAVANVPEPGTISLFAFGLGALAARKRIRRIAGA
jgi:hypothetical protein